MCFVLFGCIRDRLVALQNSVHNRPNCANVRATPLDSKLTFWFMPRSRVGIFHNERTRSTPLKPKLMFWCVSYHLGPLGFLTKLGAKRSELVQKFVPRSRVATKTPDPPHWNLNTCFVAFCTIWVHLGLLSCLTKLGAKCSELVLKFGTFCPEFRKAT